MTGHNFILEGNGGWLRPLPTGARAEIQARWPGLNLDATAREFSWYIVRRDATKGQPAASEISQIARDFQAEVLKMIEALETVRGNNIGSLIEAEPARFGYNHVLNDLWKSLQILKISLPRTIPQMPKGHMINNRQVLVRNLVPLIQEAGIPVNYKPNGAVCHVVGVFLDAAGEATSSVVAIVRPVILEMKKMGLV